MQEQVPNVMLPGTAQDAEHVKELITRAAELDETSESSICKRVCRDFYFLERLDNGRVTVKKMLEVAEDLQEFIKDRQEHE